MLLSIDLNRFHNFNIVYHYVCPGSKYSRTCRKTKTKADKIKQMGNPQDAPIIPTGPVSIKGNSTMSKLSFGFMIRPFLLICIMLLCLSKLPHLFSSRVYHQQIYSLPSDGPSDLGVLHNRLSFSLPSPNGLGVAKGFSTMISHIIRGIRPFYMTDTNG